MTSRRAFLQTATLSAVAGSSLLAQPAANEPLQEFSYQGVHLAPGLAQRQFDETQSVLLSLNEDSLLKPWRLRAGLPAPGPEMGGWYDEVVLQKTESGGHGFAPGHCFGQWLSALARGYAVDRAPEKRAKLERLLALYQPAISGKFYTNFRFPAYNFDKMVIGLIDAQKFAGIKGAGELLDLTADAAVPHLPPTALDRDEPQRRWRASIGENTANDYTWDESYTLPENLFLAWERGHGERYKTLASRFLLDRTYFDPLSENKNVLPNHHAYSFCNALSSAMQAYLASGSVKHLRAASNAFEMIGTTQSFATGAWGPNESFVEPGTGALGKSLTATHKSFETPCGSYAHFKLTRYLLRVKRDGRYGDSMERVLYNTVLGALPLQADGRAFYYSDYNGSGSKTYFPDRWPCCAGTLPQVAADYRIVIYFRDPSGVLVNLYLPSTLNWIADNGAQFTLTQSGAYPLDERVSFSVRSSRPANFTLSFRIPAWALDASVSVNGVPVSTFAPENGFVAIRRNWKSGDRVDLTLPQRLRLEPVDPQHPNTVALLRGPLVLFAVGEDFPAVAREHLLAAQKDPSSSQWQMMNAARAMHFRPFTQVGDDPYSTYLTVT